MRLNRRRRRTKKIPFLKVYEGKLDPYNKALAFSWNDQLDLVLVFTSPKDYYIMRPLLRKPVLQQKSTDEMMCFCWGSYGKTYSVGDDKGKISVHNIEDNGGLLYSFHLELNKDLKNDGVRDLMWLNSDDLVEYGQEKYIDRNFLKVLQIPKAEILLKYKRGVYQAKRVKKGVLNKHYRKFDVLVVASQTTIFFRQQGDFQFCTLNVPSLMDVSQNDVSIIRAILHRKFIKLGVLVKCENQLWQQIIDTASVGRNKSQLYFIGEHYQRLKVLVSNIGDCLTQAQRSYDKKIVDEVIMTFLKPWEEIQTRFETWHKSRLGMDVDPSESESEGKEKEARDGKAKYGSNLMFTLEQFVMKFKVTGWGEEALVEFLRDHGTEKRLLKMGIEMEHRRDVLQKLLLKYLHPSLKRAIARVSRVLGCVRWEEEFGELGMDRQKVEKLLVDLKKLYVKSSHIADELGKFSQHMCNFIEYLRQTFRDLLIDPRLRERVGPGHPMWFSFSMQKVRKFIKMTNSPPDLDDLQQAYGVVAASIEPIFSEVNASISGKCFAAEPAFCLTKQVSSTVVDIKCHNDEHYQYVGVLIPNNTLVIYRYDATEPASASRRRIRKQFMVLHFELRVIQFQFYRNTSVYVLVEEQNEQQGGEEEDEKQCFVGEFLYNQFKFVDFQDVLIEDLPKRGEGHYNATLFEKVRACPFGDVTHFALGERGLGNVYSEVHDSVCVYDFEDFEEKSDGNESVTVDGDDEEEMREFLDGL